MKSDSGGGFSTVVLSPPQKERVQWRKREPRESCFGPEYQRGFQEEGGLMLWDRKEGWTWPGEAGQGRFPGRGGSARRLELGVFWEPGGGQRRGGRRKGAEVGRSHGAPQPAVRAGSFIPSQQGAPDKA